MSKFLKGFVCGLLIACGACAPLGRHMGLDVSKTDEIMLATGDGKSGNTLKHESFPNCVVVDCDDASLHVPLDSSVCRSTSARKNSKRCGVLRGAIMVAGLTEEDDPLENKMVESEKAKLALDSDGELFYSVEAFPTKKIYLDQVLDVIFHALPEKVVGSTATVVIPHDFLFEQRQAMMDSLMRSRKIEVTQSLRFNPCTASENQECSAIAHIPHSKVSLDSVVVEQLEKDASHHLPSNAPITAVVDEKETEISQDSAPSRRVSGSTREEIERLGRMAVHHEVLYGGATYYPTATTIPSGVPTFVPSVIPSSAPSQAPSSAPAHGPTTSTPTHARVNIRSLRPSFSPTAAPASEPTNNPTNNPTNAPITTPTSFPTSAPVIVPTSVPSDIPSYAPTMIPSNSPSTVPSHIPTRSFTSAPTIIPTMTPSSVPTSFPVHSPTSRPSSPRMYDRTIGAIHGYNNGEAGMLTASEWTDTKNYSFWKTLVNCTGRAPQCFAHVEKKWNLCSGYPIGVSVSQLDDENPVSDLSIAIFSESHMKMKGFGRTNVNGNTTVFLKIDDPHCNYDDDFLTDLRVSIQIERAFMGEFEVKNVKRQDGIPQVHFVIDRKIQQENTLDLMFVTDTTGSMADELSFLKSDLEKIIENVQQACADDTQVKIRTSVNFYRDVGDEYVVKGFPFDTDVKRNVKRVSAQFASGGGDFPEAVDRALDDALFNHKWSKKHGAKARLLFLILDAPPHWNRGGIDSLVKTIKRAQKVGVRIIPVTGSGIDKETEMLMRVFGIVTDGSYIHLTDDSGVGLSHVETETTIPDHPVGKLLDVMVGTIRRYLGCTADEDKLGANVKVN